MTRLYQYILQSQGATSSASHFDSRRPRFLETQPLTGRFKRYQITMLQTLDILVDKYAISLETGFLPNPLPLQKLAEPYYAPWEDLASTLAATIQAGTLRQTIDDLPVLSTKRLKGEAEWRRAYVILAFLMHAYIWGGEKPREVSSGDRKSVSLRLDRPLTFVHRSYHRPSHVHCLKSRLT